MVGESLSFNGLAIPEYRLPTKMVLMQNLRTNLPTAKLLTEAERQPFVRDGAGIDMAHPSDAGFPRWLNENGTPFIVGAIKEIESLVGGKATHIMLNRLRAGDTVNPHIDHMDTGERWHLVLTTNTDSFWWDETDGEVHMEAGYWWGPVPYKRLHAVWNHGDSDRIHLVVDVRR